MVLDSIEKFFNTHYNTMSIIRHSTNTQLIGNEAIFAFIECFDADHYATVAIQTNFVSLGSTNLEMLPIVVKFYE